MKKGATKKLQQKRIRDILFSFSHPNTPKQVERKLGIGRLRLKPYLEDVLLKSLNPGARKGRLYTLTDEARKQLNVADTNGDDDTDWELVGWILASPRQRLSVLSATDFAKRSSEAIRKRGSRSNPHLTRVSNSSILRELAKRGLVHTGKEARGRHYWLSEKGKQVLEMIAVSSRSGE